jgi:hypothetical protein
MNIDFDKILIEKGIKFLPWIGEDYFDFSPRILILGESHYFGESHWSNVDEYNNDVNATRAIVDDYCHSGLIKLASMLTNKTIDNDYIFDYICFYNFFQKCVGIKASEKTFIDESLIEMSQKAFFHVIEILSPELIIAWGVSSLYGKWLPQDNREIIDEKNKLFKYKQYPKTIIWNMKHPSRMFDLYGWTHKFKDDVCERLNYPYPIK